VYENFVQRVFQFLVPEYVQDVSIGGFRMNKDYLKKCRKQRPESSLLMYPFECRQGVYGYPKALEEELAGYVKAQVVRYMGEEKIFV
jgi:spore photoproduct lyase